MCSAVLLSVQREIQWQVCYLLLHECFGYSWPQNGDGGAGGSLRWHLLEPVLSFGPRGLGNKNALLVFGHEASCIICLLLKGSSISGREELCVKPEPRKEHHPLDFISHGCANQTGGESFWPGCWLLAAPAPLSSVVTQRALSHAEARQQQDLPGSLVCRMCKAIVSKLPEVVGLISKNSE